MESSADIKNKPSTAENENQLECIMESSPDIKNKPSTSENEDRSESIVEFSPYIKNKPSTSENKNQFESQLGFKEKDFHLSGIYQASNSSDEVDYDFSLRSLPEEYKKKYDAYVNDVKAVASIPILDSVSEEHIKTFKHFNLRYYEDMYCVDFGVSEPIFGDVNVRIHTNKLMLIALATGNEIIQNNRPIVHINFVINNIDRSHIKLKGKKKRGSKGIEASTILCQVKCEGNDKLYNIRAGVKGSLIEINEYVKDNPDLLRTDPKGMGYIAVIMPLFRPTDGYEKIAKKLLTQEKYVNYLLHRPPHSSTATDEDT